jgi:alkaline phosphatase
MLNHSLLKLIEIEERQMMSNSKKFLKTAFVLALAGAFITTNACADVTNNDKKKVRKAKNVIVMISDGAGYNTHLSAEFWKGEKQPYDHPNFAKYAVATYNLRVSGPGDDTQDPALVYDPQKAWDATPLPYGTDDDNDGYLDLFKGYQWLQATDPDSAGTMSAIVTGRKVYRGGINVDGLGGLLVTAPEVAKMNGKSTGSISSVRYNHATPAAGGGAHNVSRNNYIDISYEMFGSGVLDVMGGPGHPWYNSNGTSRTVPAIPSSRFDGPLYNVISLGAGTASHTTVDGRTFTVNGSEWAMYDEKSDIENLASGAATVPAGKNLMMLPKVYGTLQYERDITKDWDGDGVIGDTGPRGTYGEHDLAAAPVNPGDDSAGDPMISTVPTLVDMTMAAINTLDDNPEGFFLSIEGGACDWAMHGNSMARMIEEHMDFNNAVQAVIDYLDAGTNGNTWGNTMLIVTSDHDHNLYGPDSDTIAFQDVSNEGAGQNPGHLWHDNSHGNQLVPAWVRGVNKNLFERMIDGLDPVHGDYIDQVDFGNVMKASLM